jgi:hypothetical protein
MYDGRRQIKVVIYQGRFTLKHKKWDSCGVVARVPLIGVTVFCDF